MSMLSAVLLVIAITSVFAMFVVVEVRRYRAWRRLDELERVVDEMGPPFRDPNP